MNDAMAFVGRCLLAALFLAGAAQKTYDPGAAMSLLAAKGLPEALIWPALAFNALAAVALIVGWQLRAVAIALAFYCMFTSWFHFIPKDGWQMSIFVKNWAIAGGFLVLAGQGGGAWRLGRNRL